jgi:hypothetical protein
MKRIIVLLVATLPVVAAAWAQTSARTDAAPSTRSAKEVRGATPYFEIKNEPAPKLIVDAPLPDLLAQGVVWVQWRAENVNIVPVFGKGALNVSPRVGHCTSTSTTCLGCGPMPATSIRSTSPACRLVRTSC